jgi:hypothetical protein
MKMNTKQKHLRRLHNELISYKKRFQSNAEISENWRKTSTILYQLCKSFPDHRRIRYILTKVTAVDRLYNAWLYRKGIRYIDVARKLQASNIDSLLKKVGDNLSLRNVKDAVTVASTVAGLGNIKNPRFIVFASKYLHFHRPNVFPILDSYAEKTMRSISNKIGLHFDDCECDSRYECFCRQILALKRDLRTVTDMQISLLDLDKLLYGKRYLM